MKTGRFKVGTDRKPEKENNGQSGIMARNDIITLVDILQKNAGCEEAQSPLPEDTKLD